MSRYILLLLSMLVLWVFSLACDHRTYYSPPATGRHYVPEQIPIKPGMIGTPEFTVSKVITLVNAQANTDWTLLGAYTHQWWGNLKMWTDTAIGVTANELKKKGATVKDDLPLMLKLALSRDQASSMLVGVVSRECPMDPEKRMERPLDTDEDGVPDYLDKCPDTPKGVRVNSLGCPLDTDGDSVPDYRDHCPRIPQGYRIDNMPFGEEEAALSDHPEDRFSSSRTFLVSPHPADRVMRLFRKELERQGMKVDKDTPDMLRFETPAQEWRDKLPAIQTALEKEGVQLTSRAPRILQLAVTGASLEWNSGEIGCTLSLRAITGDGDILDFKGTNRARDLYDSCNGAITKQVAAMFNDDRVRVYLAAPIGPKDSDGDGVRDEIDQCPATPLGVAVDAKGCPLDSDADGVPDFQDKCPETPKGVEVDKAGCPMDSDGDGVPDRLDKCPETPKGARVDSEGCWTISEAFFDFDKHDIDPRFFPALDEVAELLKNNPSLRIVIEGYTDNVGTKAYNQKLSEERARAVQRYLISKGIQENRLSTVGYGYSMPKASNDTPEGRAQNRRVKLEPFPLPAK